MNRVSGENMAQNRKYEPPKIVPVNSMLEQAFGSTCQRGDIAAPDPCTRGDTADSGCTRGETAQTGPCTRGQATPFACQRGDIATGVCMRGGAFSVGLMSEDGG